MNRNGQVLDADGRTWKTLPVGVYDLPADPDQFWHYVFQNGKVVKVAAAPPDAHPIADLSRYPGKCLACASPAYQGLGPVQCSNKSCKFAERP